MGQVRKLVSLPVPTGQLRKLVSLPFLWDRLENHDLPKKETLLDPKDRTMIVLRTIIIALRAIMISQRKKHYWIQRIES